MRALRWLGRPLSVAFGPTFELETRSAGRRRTTYINRLVIGVLIVGIAFLGYLGSASEASWSAGPARLQALQGLAPALAATVIWTQFILLGLIAPTATAGAICDEHRKRTFPALLTTPLTASHLVVGKLLGRVSELLVLTLLPAPMLLALRVFGGLRAELVLAAAALIGTTVLSGAALGLLASVRARRSSTASSIALALVVALQMGPLLAVALVGLWGGMGGPPPRWIIWAFETSPMAALMSISVELLAEAGGMPFLWSSAWVKASLLHLGIAAGAVLLAIVLLRPSIRSAEVTEARVGGGVAEGDRERSAESEADGGETGAGLDRARSKARRRGVHRATGRSREVVGNPVLWREMRGGTQTGRMVKVLGFVLLLMLAAWVYWQAGVQAEDGHMGIAILGTIGALCHALGSAASAISGEREARTLDALLTAPMSPRRVLWGKLAGSLRKLWIMPLAVLIATGVAGVGTSAIHPVYLLFAPMAMLPPMVLISATGLLYSVLLKRPMTALSLNVMTAGAMWVGGFVAIGMLSWLAKLDAEDLSGPFFMMNPVFQVGSLIDDLHGANGVLSRDWTIAIDVRVSFLTYTMFMLAYALGYLGAAWGVLELAARCFNARMGRPS